MAQTTWNSALDRFIGIIEDIIITEEFQVRNQFNNPTPLYVTPFSLSKDIITSFMDKYHPQFDYAEENKLCYIGIFQEYQTTIESYLTDKIKEIDHQTDPSSIEFESLIAHIPNHQSPPLQDQGEVIELILSLTDFLVFKELILDHKRAKSGQYDHFDLLQVISIDRK